MIGLRPSCSSYPPSSSSSCCFLRLRLFVLDKEHAKIDVRSLAEGLEEGYPVSEDEDIPIEDY